MIARIKSPDGEFSFQKIFKIFVACINPRSFQGLSQQNKEPRFIERQNARLETVLKRLVLGTTFEKEGWKKLIPTRNIFTILHLDIDDYEIRLEKIKKINFQVIYFSLKLMEIIC